MKSLPIYFTLSLFVLFLLCYPLNTMALQWANSFGGLGKDSASAVRPTADGGFIVTGMTKSFSVADSDIWLVKLNSGGTVQWEKTYGGTGADNAAAVVETPGGGYVVAGSTTSFGAGGTDLWVLKLDANGNVGPGYPGTWQKSYGGAGNESSYGLVSATGGGYVIAARTDSYGAGNGDIWFLKLSETGVILWEKTHGTTGIEMAPSISATSDGGYVAVAETQADNSDIWVLKLNSAGNMEWEYRYGMQSFVPPDTWNENVESWPQIHQALDGNYVIASISQSILGGMPNLWMLKIESDGSILWQQYISELSDTQTVDIRADGSGSVLALKRPKGTSGNTGRMLKVNDSGVFQWGLSYGGDTYNSSDYINSIVPLAGGGFIGAGSSDSFDVNGGDFWVLKMDANGAIPGCEAMSSFTSGFGATDFHPKAVTSVMVETSTAVQDTNAAILVSDAFSGDGCAPPSQPVLSVGLPRTGQTACYNDGAAVIPCAGSGQDGEIQAGVAWPSPRFQDNGDGTITDKLTGLIWLKDANCARTISHDPDGAGNGSMFWTSALDFVAGINSGTHNISSCASFTANDRDWRMANVNELSSLMFNPGVPDPTGWLLSNGFVNIGLTAPNAHLSKYWTSTTENDFNNGWAWVVAMGPDSLDSSRVFTSQKGHSLFLTWPVRAGQDSLPDPTYPANVWKTGQKTSYHTGDDGEHQAGVLWPDPRFSDHGDGTVTDNLTGLTWLKDADCFGMKLWMDALASVDDFNSNPANYSCEEYTAAHNDWRLPNRNEYQSLLDHSIVVTASKPALPEGHPFVKVIIGPYWTSTTHLYPPGTNFASAWEFYTNGTLNGAAKSTWDRGIWPVRGESRGIVQPQSSKILFLVIPAAIHPPAPSP